MKALGRGWTVALLAVLGGCQQAARDEAGQISEAGSVDAFEMRIGDCFNDGSIGADAVFSVPGVPCAEPHANEVYATFDLADGPWPGTELVESKATDGCYDRFAKAIGATYEESDLYFSWLVPTAESWGELDDREVVCFAYEMEGEDLVGTVIGSGR